MTSTSETRSSETRSLFRLFWEKAGAHPREIVLPTSLILLGSASEAFSFGLLLPLSRAFTEENFDFLEESFFFGWIPNLLPGGWGGDQALVVLLLLLIVLSRILVLVFDYFRKIYVDGRNETYRARIGSSVFRRVLAFGRPYFDRRSLGEVETEIDWVQAAPQALVALEMMFQRGVRLLVKIGLMFACSVPLTFAFFLILPAVVLLLRFFKRYADRTALQAADLERRIRRASVDILGMIPLVKVLSREEVASQSYTEALRSAEGLEVQRTKVLGLRWPLTEALILLPILGVQAALILLLGEFRMGDLVPFAIFLLLLQQSFPDFDAISAGGITLAHAMPKLKTVAGLFDDHGKGIVSSGDQEFLGVSRELKLTGIDFAYSEDSPVLHGVSATIPARMMTAVVGKSGSGKTTLIDLIVRFHDSPPGKILIDGADIRDYSLSSLHERMAVVGQESWLLNRSLRENLVFGLDSPPPDIELRKVLDELAMGPFLAALPGGLDTEIGDRGVRISGGERQRLGIARALLREPEFLILDEATSALDSVVEAKVLQAIEERCSGKTLLVIAHRLSTVRRADLILVMDSGRIVESGSWNELLERRGPFYRLYQAQYRGEEVSVS